MTQLVAGQRAAVTGGGTGLGFATAKRLVEHGAHVLIAGRRGDVLDSVAAELEKLVASGSLATHACDVTDEDQVAATIAVAAGISNTVRPISKRRSSVAP